MDAHSHMMHLDQMHASKNIWWIISAVTSNWYLEGNLWFCSVAVELSLEYGVLMPL